MSVRKFHGVNRLPQAISRPVRWGRALVGVSADVKPSRYATRATFCERVPARRTELGLGQEQDAEKTGIHLTYLGWVERGQRSLRLESVLKFAAGLETAPGYSAGGPPTE